MFQRSRSSQAFRRLGQRLLIGQSLVLLSFIGTVGCDITDLFSEQFLIGIGQDVIPPPAATGTVIVTITNNTPFVAVMRFLAEPDAQRVPEGFSEQFFTQVPLTSGETQNQVFDCPLDRVRPGLEGVRQDGTDDVESTSAATVFTTNMADDGGVEQAVVEIAYLGSPLLSGRDYQCGDVIAISVAPQPATENEPQFRIFVEILPGA